MSKQPSCSTSGLGKHRLDRLTPEHIERFYTCLETEGLAPATVLQIHRILSRALKVALQRGYIARNVATLVDAPSVACPQRTGGGLQLTELRSDKSRRTIALSAPLVTALKAHRAEQLKERMTAGSAWTDGDYVWCQRNGRPIGPHADWEEWKALLKDAGIRDARVHDALHTAATLLLAQGVDQRVIMEILGHSQISMTAKYAHVLPQVMTDAADRIGQALWGQS